MSSAEQTGIISTPLWLRPSWWIWLGLGVTLAFILALGQPLISIVHCATHPLPQTGAGPARDSHRQHLPSQLVPGAQGLSQTGAQQPATASHGSATACSPQDHSVPDVSYPGVVFALLLLAGGQRLIARLAALSSWLTSLILTSPDPPPRLA